nr:MAG TPA: Mu-scoloptoxin-Ssm6a-SLPTX-Ssm6a, Gating modifier, Sodium 1.7 [Caudoviricetes sp.]
MTLHSVNLKLTNTVRANIPCGVCRLKVVI